MPKASYLWIGILFLLIAVGVAWWFKSDEQQISDSINSSIEADPTTQLSFEEYTHSYFSDESLLADVSPIFQSIPLPRFPSAFAIWGATGRDRNGHIWFGISSYQAKENSAHLCEYNPDTNQVTDHGDVLQQLRRIGKYRSGDQQPKIHTKILQMEDGHLYFASMDEDATSSTGEKPPKSGSHLWRYRIKEKEWDWLANIPEGWIALTGGGSTLYGLAYPDHTLLRYDLRTKDLKKVKVGTVEGHISRNIVSDYQGHVYVPRLRRVRADHAQHTLVEFDANLKEVGENLLSNYQFGAASQSHGLVGYTHLQDRSIVIITHSGRLLRIIPQARQAARLEDYGWFHPDGKSYTPSIFSYSGIFKIVGLGIRSFDGGKKYEWISFDLQQRKAKAEEAILPKIDGFSAEDSLLYGCHTRDSIGSFYIVGAYRKTGGRQPVLLRALPYP